MIRPGCRLIGTRPNAGRSEIDRGWIVGREIDPEAKVIAYDELQTIGGHELGFCERHFGVPMDA
jgi:hypothetical protein